MRIAKPLFVLFVCVAFSAPADAELTKPGPRDRQIANIVSSLLHREHLSRRELDDEMSERCVGKFLESLDPMKVYFLQSDIDRFLLQRHELDDQISEGNVDFAYTVFNTFLDRIDERVELVDEFLAMQHDFTVDEKMVKDRDEAQYARNREEVRDQWRKRIKYDLLLLKAEKRFGDQDEEKEDEDPIKKLSQRYHFFATRMHQTDGEELLEIYLTAMTMGYDPHTSYMSPSSYENFIIDIGLELEGIGAALQPVNGHTVVKEIIPGGAADKDGRLQPEDKIVGVGQGIDGEIQDVVGMKLDDVVHLIRGKRNTVVRLNVTSTDGETQVIEITRELIKLTDREAKSKIFEVGGAEDGSPYHIGVIDLPSFYMDMDGARAGLPNYKSTTRDLRRILDEFNDDEEGVDAVILDLRRNGGGSLQESINTTGLFIKDGPVVQVKDADGAVHPYYDPDGRIFWSGPFVVLTSKFSASASEIFAGAIQDYGRGLIVGDSSTHGKGTVQSLTNLGDLLWRNGPKLGALKITMQQFYRPNGDSTQNRGVLADVELPSLSTHYDSGEASLDYSIAFDRVEALEFNKNGDVNEDICRRLRALSEPRLLDSKEFQTVLRNIAIFEERKERKYVTLNEEEFMAELEELNADKEERKTMEELRESNDGVKRTYYLDEALAITADFLQLLSADRTR